MTLIDNVDVLHCEIPLIFGACVDYVFHLAFSICCIAEHLLYLAHELKLVIDMALPMSCIAKHLIFGACVELRFELTMWMC